MDLLLAPRTALLVLGALCISSFPTLCSAQLPTPNQTTQWKTADISRDVCIIGGGSSGTYAAIRLLDMNQSVVVVERTDRLGGNTQTFIDPVTGAPVEIGVEIWHNNTLVTDYFARLNVPLTFASISASPFVTQYADFRTGKVVSGYTAPDPTIGFEAYVTQLLNYPFLDNGFALPDPVPSDLLLPFGQFALKYNISGAVSAIWQTCQGIGNILEVPTLYVMKYFGLTVLQGLQNGFVTTASHDNSQLYQSAQAVLTAANALLLKSDVVSTVRNNDRAQIEVSTPDGYKRIECKKIVLGIPPSLKNLQPFGFNATELSLFQQFSHTGYYTGLLRDTGIPDNTSIQNTVAQAPFNIPSLPSLYSFGATGVPGLHQVLYASTTVIPIEQVKQDILASLRKLQTTGTVPLSEPKFAVFASHSPFEFTVSTSAIKDGFYRRLNSLQGERRLFLTGAAFESQDSSLIWQFTETLLPSIIA